MSCDPCDSFPKKYNNIDVLCKLRVRSDLKVAGTSILNEVEAQNITVSGSLTASALNSNNISTESITAHDATIQNLVATNMQTENLQASELTVGSVSAETSQIHQSNIEIANIKAANINDEIVGHSNIDCLKTFPCQRFSTPNYNRFEEGLFPPMNKVPGTDNTYEYVSLSPYSVPESGASWDSTVQGIIDFDSASVLERLNFYTGSLNRLYRLIIDRPFALNEEKIRLGYIPVWWNTGFQPALPQDQQALVAKALKVLLSNFLKIKAEVDINPLLLEARDKVNLYNHITLCSIYIEAFNIGDFWTGNMGQEVAGIANSHCLENYRTGSAYYAPFIALSYLIAAGVNTDAATLVVWARSLPLMFKYFAIVLNQQVKKSIDGLKTGHYPHILRVNPYESKGKSTFGDPEYGYEQYIVDAINNGTFPTSINNNYTKAKTDFKYANYTYDQQGTEEAIFGPSQFAGLNPTRLLNLVVSQGQMSKEESTMINDICRKLYETDVQPAMLSYLNNFFLDENSPIGRALRLTRYDDYPGEWGLKFLVNEKGLVKGKTSTQDVLIDVLGKDVVIYDANMNVLNISLKTVTLLRDEAYGEAHYNAMIQVILGLQSDANIPTLQKVKPDEPYNPTTNPYKAIFITDPNLTLVEKINLSGKNNTQYFYDNIEYNLNLWSIEKYGKPWKEQFSTFEEALAAQNFDDRFISDLEDPAKEGNYCFIQHFKPATDNGVPVYNYADLRAYYTDDPKGKPHLKLKPNGRVDGAPIKDKNGNILYDPEAPLVDGFIDILPLYKASTLDTDLLSYYRSMTNVNIANGKSARYFYFNFDFEQHAYESFITGGVNPSPDPIMQHYFSPYLVSVFNKRHAQTYRQSNTASSSNFNPTTKVLTYTNLLSVIDPLQTPQGANLSLFLHEWLMGHAMQVPLVRMLSTLGINPWTADSKNNGSTIEGWAVFIELYFGGKYTTYLSKTDHYYNYLCNDCQQDPKAVVSQFKVASRIAARLKWDTALHSAKDKVSMAQYMKGFAEDTFGQFTAFDEIAQRIPIAPGQALTYGLSYIQLVSFFESLPERLGQAKFDELQANGNKAWKYYFDLILIDAQGYFLGSLEPLYNDMIFKIKNGIAPYDNPNYDGYPLNAFPVNTVPYVVGTNPAAYEYNKNPYVAGGFNFKFPDKAIPTSAPIPSQTTEIKIVPPEKKIYQISPNHKDLHDVHEHY